MAAIQVRTQNDQIRLTISEWKKLSADTKNQVMGLVKPHITKAENIKGVTGDVWYQDATVNDVEAVASKLSEFAFVDIERRTDDQIEADNIAASNAKRCGPPACPDCGRAMELDGGYPYCEVCDG